jgi:hypothetical protein
MDSKKRRAHEEKKSTNPKAKVAHSVFVDRVRQPSENSQRSTNLRGRDMKSVAVARKAVKARLRSLAPRRCRGEGRGSENGEISEIPTKQLHLKGTGGAGGIRTLDRALQPYNGLANRRLQPLGHSSVGADMPDTGASRKPQIVNRPFQDRLEVPVSEIGLICVLFGQQLSETSARELPVCRLYVACA